MFKYFSHKGDFNRQVYTSGKLVLKKKKKINQNFWFSTNEINLDFSLKKINPNKIGNKLQINTL